jgi:hypothetical protein
VDRVLPEELIQFQVSAADAVGVPAGQKQVFKPVVRLCFTDILGYRQEIGF